MIDIKQINDIDTSNDCGKLLLMALSILTTIDEIDIKEKKFGGRTHPDSALGEVINLANKVFYEYEYESFLNHLKGIL